jgi:hypothetical protein
VAIIERQAGSLAELFNSVREIRNSWNPERDQPEEIWFRGQARRRYKLAPGLYRDHVADLGYDEPTIVRAFENLGVSYVAQRPANAWEWYFLAQHYRLPTRLLDWTESLLTALYFALDEFWRTADKRATVVFPDEDSTPVFDEESPTIWIVDAGSVNLFAHGKDVLWATHRKEIECYLPRLSADPIPDGCFVPRRPIAVIPPRQNPRIIAQQGMFTIHGTEQAPLDGFASDNDPDSTIHLGCVHLDRSRLNWFLDDLVLAGVTRSTLFPELDSVAENIKWNYRV